MLGVRIRGCRRPRWHEEPPSSPASGHLLLCFLAAPLPRLSLSLQSDAPDRCFLYYLFAKMRPPSACSDKISTERPRGVCHLQPDCTRPGRPWVLMSGILPARLFLKTSTSAIVGVCIVCFCVLKSSAILHVFSVLLHRKSPGSQVGTMATPAFPDYSRDSAPPGRASSGA